VVLLTTTEPGASTLAPASTPPSPLDVPEEVPLDVPDEVPLDVPDEAPLDVPEEVPLDVPDEVPLDVPEEVPDEVPELLVVVAVPSAVEPSGLLLLLPPLELLLQPATQTRPAEHATKQPTATRFLMDSPTESSPRKQPLALAGNRFPAPRL
jgi:hypothetical protein